MLKPSAGERWTKTLREALLIALIVSHSIAAIDLIYLIIKLKPLLFSLFDLLPILGASFGLSLVIYVVLWVGIALPLKVFGRLPPLPLSIGLGIGILLPLLTLIVQPVDDRLSLIASSYPVLLILGASLAVGSVGYAISRALLDLRDQPRLIATVVFAAPLVCIESLVYIWYRFYHMGGGLSKTTLAVALAYLLAIGCTSLLVSRPRVRDRALPCLLALGVLLGFGALVPRSWTMLAAGAKQPSGERHHPVKRVLLLSVDTLRRDALQYYGPAAPPTPNLDQLAADSVVFRNAYSPAPWTLPAFASIMTGLSPWVHGVSWASIPTLADYFRDQGYLTAAIGLNGFLAEQRALARRFREYNVTGTKYANSLGIQVLKGLMAPHRLADRVSSDQLTERSKAWIRSHRNDEFFLWVHYLDPHDPYAPPPAFFPDGHFESRIGRGFEIPWTQVRAGYVSYSPGELAAIRALYESEVRYVDDYIGQIVSLLKELGLYDETLIAFTSDHGEEFWEHGGLGHGQSLYNELLAVPLFIKQPQTQQAGHHDVERPVSTESLLPTLLELCEIDFNRDALSGVSLTPLWREDSEARADRGVYSTALIVRRVEQSVIYDGWKYVRSFDPDREELYDLGLDPLERRDLAAASPRKAAQLREMLEAHGEESERLRAFYGLEDAKVQKDREDARRRLKSLGYIQ